MSGKLLLQPIEISTDCDPTPPIKIDLRDAHAIRREMASVYRDMRSGKIDAQMGTRLAYVLEMLRKTYETSVLQEQQKQILQVLEIREIK